MKTVTDAVRDLGGVWPDRPTPEYQVWRITGALYDRTATAPPSLICTRTEFDAEVERVRNKPGWSEAPEWANWLTQDGKGWWVFHEHRPVPNGLFDHPHWRSRIADSQICGHGEVLGDWRDTLEHRPEKCEIAISGESFTPEGIQRLMEALGDICQWDEKSELPPIGTRCEYISRIDADKEGVITHHMRSGNGEMIALIEYDNLGFDLGAVGDFRPLQSDRDRWVEAAETVVEEATGDTAAITNIEALYDAMTNGTLPIPEVRK